MHIISEAHVLANSNDTYVVVCVDDLEAVKAGRAAY